MTSPMIKFCRRCGTEMTYEVPPTEDRERAVCPSCGYIDYVNPINVVGTVPTWGEARDQVLLCRRNIEPRKGLWTLPAGFLEWGEGPAEGAERETREESGAQGLDLGQLFTLIAVPHAGQVHIFYLATLASLDLDPGPETIENHLFGLDEIPWDEIAFKTVEVTLRHYVQCHSRGEYPFLETSVG